MAITQMLTGLRIHFRKVVYSSGVKGRRIHRRWQEKAENARKDTEVCSFLPAMGGEEPE